MAYSTIGAALGTERSFFGSFLRFFDSSIANCRSVQFDTEERSTSIYCAICTTVNDCGDPIGVTVSPTSLPSVAR